MNLLKKFLFITSFCFMVSSCETNENKFDPSTIILMDFRCNQSRGLHFIYVIPFSKKKALIESTLFSKNVEDRKFYLSAINSYLKEYFKTKEKRFNISLK